MTIGKGPHQQRILFVPLERAPVSNESDSDSLKTDNLESQRIHTNDSSNDEVELHAIEAVPNEGIPPPRQILTK